MKNLKEIYFLLQRLRDWKTHPLPFNALMMLLALDHAGEIGMRSNALGRVIGRDAASVGTMLKPLVKAGLVEVVNESLRQSKCFYRITQEGRARAAELFTEERPAKEEVPA